ncbi:Ppx/GppA family phosphatase [Clostridium sp. cel8]|uniref:Ppx/GppA family phosphatase n=1 Tax=Clostridium sp. cel8 TaxID=2663123 RepID=UPI0015F4C8C6|nr:Ppx/GppA family phosphatase [Clostridium sp. cel8]MBA5851367.1 Ppx/GppA family phosphatase [Clostridium sp. cel8]
MDKIAIIDIGSNSMRIVIVKISKDRAYEVLDELKYSVRLGKDMTENGALSEDRIKAAMEALAHFKRLCDANNVNKIIAVATEAVRKASNKIEFIKMVKEKFQIDVRILTGEEESYYDYLGVINSIDIQSGLIVDIGGSSMELILVKNRSIKNCISVPMGAITLTDKLLSIDGDIYKKSKGLIKYIKEVFNSIDFLKEVENVPLIGIGGSFRTVGKVHRNKVSYPFNNSHNYVISRKDIIQIYNSLKYKEISKYREVKGISKDRWDIFPGAFIAIVTLVKYCNFKKVIISGNGIRQGLIYKMTITSDDHVIENMLNFSLNTIIHNFNLNQEHVKRVWEFSKEISKNIVPELYSNNSNYKILKTAAYLHDCGVFIGSNRQTKYSFSIVRDIKIYGLTHRQQLMAAFVISNFEDYKIRKSYYFGSIIKNKDVVLIQKMNVILNIAKALDRASDGNIVDVKISSDKDKVLLKIKSKMSPSLELTTVSYYEYNFEQVFGKKLIVNYK